jgi:hypothetical protein
MCLSHYHIVLKYLFNMTLWIMHEQCIPRVCNWKGFMLIIMHEGALTNHVIKNFIDQMSKKLIYDLC